MYVYYYNNYNNNRNRKFDYLLSHSSLQVDYFSKLRFI